jgi:hypothetical protein
LNRITIISLILCIVVAIVWIDSQSHDRQFSFHYDGSRITLHSCDGRLTLASPPSPFAQNVRSWNDGISDNTVAATHQAVSDAFWAASNMHVILEKAPIRPASQSNPFSWLNDRPPAAWETVFYDRNGVQKRANVIALLSAMEDPLRCPLAEKVLAHYATWQTVRTSHTYSDPQNAVRRFHDLFDQRIVSVWYGTLFGCTAVLPLVWLTRPRRQPSTLLRRIFNVFALTTTAVIASLLIARLTPSMTYFSIRLVFDSHRSGAPAETFLLIDWNGGAIGVGAMKGRVHIGEWTESHDIQCREYSLLSKPIRPVVTLKLSQGMFETTGWALQASYLIAIATLIPIPSLWTILAFRSRRKPSFATCNNCGYDLRATPSRCPECGLRVAVT